MIEDLYQKFLSSTGVSTDTRSIKKGNIYFALKGANFNGNQFVQQATESGADYCVIDEKEYVTDNCILVDDVLTTLQELANYHRERFTIPFIGITGSNGKTTTKELITQVLSKKYRVHSTKGNFNNHIGVPLTLLSIEPDIDIAIIEMGANKPGDIKELCDIANPNYGIITNIGRAHIEGFGSFEGVARTKSELYLHLLQNSGTVFVNGTNEHLARMTSRFKNPIKFLSEGSFLNVELIDANPFVRYRDESGNEVQTQLIGAYNFENIAAALCIGKYFQVPEDDANQAITEYVSENNRSQVVEKEGRKIILDAYNANPTSMSAAIRNFAEMEGDDKLVILGDMFELGAESDRDHQEIIALTKSLNLKGLFCGKNFCKNGKAENNIKFFESRESMEEELENHPPAEALILVKGSRGIGLEKIVEYL